MKKIFITTLLAVTFVFFSLISVRADDTLTSKFEDAKQFINNNLKNIEADYNKTVSSREELINIEGVEQYTLAYILDDDCYAIYADFNGDAGYLIASLDLILYKIDGNVELDYLKDVELVLYSIMDGFVYFDGLGYQSYGYEEKEANITYGYNGQYGNGDGEIYDVDGYVSDRHPDYELASTQRFIYNNVYFTPIIQFNTSFYVQYTSYDGGYTYSGRSGENNCTLHAAFLAMDSWQKANYLPNLPSFSQRIDATDYIRTDYFYDIYGVGSPRVGQSSYWTVNYNYVPNANELYYRLRNLATYYHFYSPTDGLTEAELINVMQRTATYYDHSITMKSYTNYINAKIKLDSGLATIMLVSNSSSYGSHATCLIGYNKYTYLDTSTTLSSQKTVYLYQMIDGLSYGITFFDPNVGNPNMTFLCLVKNY